MSKMYISFISDEEIDEESFLFLKEKDFINLIPKIGPRSRFRKQHKAFLKVLYKLGVQ